MDTTGWILLAAALAAGAFVIGMGWVAFAGACRLGAAMVARLSRRALGSTPPAGALPLPPLPARLAGWSRTYLRASAWIAVAASAVWLALRLR
jgi:hypothetical protein